jgi:hypothetical protein
MENSQYRADVIEVIETGAIKTVHNFNTPAELLGQLHMTGSKSQGQFQGADGTNLEFRKVSFWKSNYELRQGEEIISSAVPQGKLRRAFWIEFNGTQYRLFPGGKGLRSWMLNDASDQVISMIKPRGAFKRGALIAVKSEISLPLLVFIYCLVKKRWQEQSS